MWPGLSVVMTVLESCGSSFWLAKVGGGGGGSGSMASFWNSKTEIFCGLPSSSTVKSVGLRPSMGLPVLGSLTVTSTITRWALAVKTGAGAGRCCPAAARANKTNGRLILASKCSGGCGVDSAPFLISEIKPQQQGHRAGGRRACGQAVVVGVDRGAETGDLHMVQHVIGGKPQLQLAAADIAEAPGAIQTAVEGNYRQAGDGI